MAKNSKPKNQESKSEHPDIDPPAPGHDVVAESAPSPQPAQWLEYLRERVPTERAALMTVFGLGFLMFFPYLGTLGLWDCWEPHYSEVAREMIARGDYVYPYWESHYFFSKPAMTLWLIAIGMLAVGAESPELGDPLGHLTEWGIRAPFALIAIFALWAVYRMTKQLRGGDRSAGLIGAVVLSTSAMFIFIGKQAMADMPTVGFSTIAMAFFCAAVFSDEDDRPAPAWMKGLTTIGIVVAVFGQVGVIGEQLHDDHRAMWPLIIPSAVGLFFIALLWLPDALALPRAAGSVYDPAQDQRTHILFSGTRSDCHLIGFYICVACASLSKGPLPLGVIGLVVVLYMLLTWDWRILLRSKVYLGWLFFLTVATPWYVTLTLFHGRNPEGQTYLERFWLHDILNRVAAGVHGDRGGLGYYIEQLAYGMFPWIGAVPFAIGFAAKNSETGRTLQQRRMTIFVLIWALTAYATMTMVQTKFHHYIFPAVPPLAVLVGYWLTWVAEDPKRRIVGYVFIPLAMIVIVTMRDLVNDPQHLVNLFTYKYDRDYPRELNPRVFLVGLSVVGGFAVVLLGVLKQKGNALLAFCASGVVFGVWISHYHFNMLAPHWSQAHIFKTYYAERRGQEPLYAYQLNWRGETFYSRNQVIQVKEGGANERMRAFVNRPGREFIVTEQSRFHTLRNVLSPDKREKLQIIDKSNNKFYLCMVEE